MVTIEQAQSQIAQQRQAIAQAQEQAREIQTAIPITRAQLQTMTPMQQVQRRQQEKARALQKARTIRALGQQQEEFEEVVSPIEAQIERAKIVRRPQVSPQYQEYLAARAVQRGIIDPYTFSGRMAQQELIKVGITDPSEQKRFIRKYGFGAPAPAVEAAVPTAPMGIPAPPTVIEPAPTTWEKVKRTLGFAKFQAEKRVGEVYVEPIQKLDIRVSERLREVPGIRQVYETAPEFGEVAGVTAPSFIQPGITYGPLKTEAERRFQAELTTRAIRAPIEKPVTTAALIAAGYGFAKVVPGAIAATGVAAPYISKGVTYGLPALYTGVKGIQMYEAPGWEERGAVVGEALTTEVLPFYLGAKLAQYDKVILRRFLKSQKTILKDVKAQVGRKKAKGKKATKSETKQIKRTEKLVDDLEQTIKTGTKQDVVRLAKNVFKSISESNLPKDTKIEYVNMYLRLLESYGVSFAPKPVTPVKEPGVVVPSKVPIEPEIITTVPPAYAGMGVYERYKPSELLLPPPIIRKEERLGETNIFEGISPIGKMEIEGLGEGLIPPLGALGSRLGVVEELGVAEELRVEEKLREKLETRADIQVRLKAEERARQRARQRIGQVQWLGLSTAQISRQRLREKQRLKRVFEKPLRPKPRPPRKVPRIGLPPPITWWLPEEKRKRRLRRERVPRRPLEFGYRVEVRRRGRFIPEVPFAVPKGEALWLGRRAVKRGAAVTFKLKKVKEKPRKIGVPRITEKALAIEFRKPIRKGITVEEPLTFIQRRRYRIVTPGERREITMKGWAARRKGGIKW